MNKISIFTAMGLICLVVILAVLKGMQFGYMGSQMAAMVMPPATVTSINVEEAQWESVISAPGELEAVKGVMVSSQLSGNVADVIFKAGQLVQQGDILIRQDISTEDAQLAAASAAAELAKSNLNRAKPLLKSKDISLDQYDQYVSQFKQAEAQMATVQASIDKKTIRAPFDGRLGINKIDVGQFLSAGIPIVSLQDLSKMLVNFSLPQRQNNRISVGQEVRVDMSNLNGQPYIGKITAISPEIDAVTRNIRVQAQIDNPNEILKPGMFVDVEVVVDTNVPVKMIPTSAILYAPFGDSVFIIEPSTENPKELKVRQAFVRLGKARGDFVDVIEGLNPGEKVVTTGLFKLFNGQTVVEDNALSPAFELNPTLKDS